MMRITEIMSTVEIREIMVITEVVKNNSGNNCGGGQQLKGIAGNVRKHYGIG